MNEVQVPQELIGVSDLRSILYALKRIRYLLICGVILGFIVALIWLLVFARPSFKCSAIILVDPPYRTNSKSDDLANVLLSAKALGMNPDSISAASHAAGLPENLLNPQTIAQVFDISTEGSSMNVSVTYSDPIQCANATNFWANILIDRINAENLTPNVLSDLVTDQKMQDLRTSWLRKYIQYHESAKSGSSEEQRTLESSALTAEKDYTDGISAKVLHELGVSTRVHARMLQKATPPLFPITKPSIVKTLLGCGVLGAFFGICIGLSQEVLTDKIKTCYDIRTQFGINAVEVIPHSHHLERPSGELHRPGLISGAAFHRIQRLIDVGRSRNQVLVISIISAEPRAGKSILAANLAAVYANSNERVLLINTGSMDKVTKDAMERPRTTRGNIINEPANLAEMKSEAGMPKVVNLPDIVDIIELHSSPTMIVEFINKIRNCFDIIIIDGPAIQDSPLALSVISLADIPLLIVRSRHTTFKEMENGLSILERFNKGRSLAVLNDEDALDRHYDGLS